VLQPVGGGLGFREEFEIFQRKLWPLFFRVLYSCCGGLFVLVAERVIEYVAHFFFPGGGFLAEWLVLISNGAALCTFLILLVKELWEYMKS